MTAITQFNTDDLKKRIAEQTQAQFGMLIPPEAFDALVTAAIKEFFETPQTLRVHEIEDPDDKSSSWNRRRVHVLSEQLTPFKQMVWLRLKEIVAPMLDAWLKEQHEALKEQMVATIEAPDMTVPFNKSVMALTTTVMTTQVHMAMESALHNVSQQVNAAFSRMGMPANITT